MLAIQPLNGWEFLKIQRLFAWLCKEHVRNQAYRQCSYLLAFIVLGHLKQ